MINKEIEHIRTEAIAETKALKPSETDWKQGLSELETILTQWRVYPYSEFESRNANKILNAMAYNGEFMLAAIFNEDHTQCTILPLPELFPDDSTQRRVQLGRDVMKINLNLDMITKSVSALLSMTHTSLGAERDVVILEQNLGTFRNDHPLEIAYLQPYIAAQLPEGKHYLDWIRGVKTELNDPSSSSFPDAHFAV